MDQFFIVLVQLVSFLIFMLVGLIGARLKIINQDFLGSVSKLIMKILLPLLIFVNTVSSSTTEQMISGYPVIILALCMFISLIVLNKICATVTRLKGNFSRVYQAAFTFGNTGYIGIPIVTALYPENAGIYIALITIIDQLFLWTYGMQMTSPADKSAKFNFKNFLNPGLCALFLGLILVLLNIKLPDIILTPLTTLGKISTPLALIYIGGLFYYSKWAFILKRVELYVGIIVKMVLFPLAFYFIASKLYSNQEIVRTISLFCSLPTMTSIAMFSKANGSEGEYALGIVLICMPVSIITISIVSYLIL